MTEIVEVSPEDWAEFREIRLRALADSPNSFGTVHATALDLAEEDWRSRLDIGVPILIVREGGTALAMGGGFCPPDAPGSMMIWGMWTAPEARGLGHGRTVVGHLLAWAREHEIDDVSLHVTEGNDGARGLYESLGFRSTGEWEPLREGSPLRIELLRRAI